MRTRITMIICLCLLFAGRASAQWVVSDPGNLAQGIINASKNIIHTSKTATNMVSNFQETVKIYQQGKKYYDALKSVNNLVKDARKVQQTILMVGDITDIYVNSFQRMLRDGNFRPEELSAIAFGYTKLLEESNEVLTELKNVVNITTLSMTDKERMDVVERCYSKMKRYRNLVSYYTNKNISVSYLRAKKKNDLDRIMGLYKGVGVENPQVKAYIAMTLSSVYAMHGNYKKSEEYLKNYDLEKSLPGILRLSKNQWEMGNRDEAIKIIKDNFQYPSNKNPMYALLVNYYTAMGDIETARRYSILRQAEDPFSVTQKLELIRLLEKSGDTQNLGKMLDEYFEINKTNNVAMIHLANYAADKGDIKMMRKIYDNAIRQAFAPGRYCLLLLETMITNGDYAGAVKFSEEILKGKPSWTKRYEDVLSAIRSIAYYATGNTNMSDILIADVLKRSRISPKTLVATARRFDKLNAPLVANSILEHAVNKFPRYQMALIRLVQNEIKIGDSTNIGKHVLRLLQMRRPPRELITDVYNSLSSDRFIFVRDRKKILDEIESLKANNSSETFSDVIPDENELHDDSSMIDI